MKDELHSYYLTGFLISLTSKAVLYYKKFFYLSMKILIAILYVHKKYSTF